MLDFSFDVILSYSLEKFLAPVLYASMRHTLKLSISLESDNVRFKFLTKYKHLCN